MEGSRLEHRYLDLRRDEMQFNLRLRSNAAMAIRQVLTKKFGNVSICVLALLCVKVPTGGLLQGLLKWKLQHCSSKLQRLGK